MQLSVPRGAPFKRASLRKSVRSRLSGRTLRALDADHASYRHQNEGQEHDDLQRSATEGFRQEKLSVFSAAASIGGGYHECDSERNESACRAHELQETAQIQ